MHCRNHLHMAKEKKVEWRWISTLPGYIIRVTGLLVTSRILLDYYVLSAVSAFLLQLLMVLLANMLILRLKYFFGPSCLPLVDYCPKYLSKNPRRATS